MESTVKYWFPIHNILKSSRHVVGSHQKSVNAIKGTKTNKKDTHQGGGY